MKTLAHGVLLALCGLAACREVHLSREGLACKAGQCLSGFVCNTRLQVCVQEVAVSCNTPDGVCPSQIHTGDTCTAVGSFIPCTDAASDCHDGCRTCSPQRAWSACEVENQCRNDVPQDVCLSLPSSDLAQRATVLSANVCHTAGGPSHAGGLTAVGCGTVHAGRSTNRAGASWTSGPVYLMAR